MNKDEILLDSSAVELLKDAVGGGGQGGEPITLGTTFAISKQIQGKHLDVDALLTLVNKYAPDGTQGVFIGLYQSQSLRGLIEIAADGSNSFIYVAENSLIETSTFESDVAEFLTNNKIAIEGAAINIQNIPDYAFLGIDVYMSAYYDNVLDTYSTATPEEILSLFVD